jgi:hypothetical protein
MNTNKKTLVIGASTKPDRYSYKAIEKLRLYGHDVIAYGVKSGKVKDVEFITELPELNEELDTITLYVNPQRQSEFYPYIINSSARRIIFNPGTENVELSDLAKKAGKEPIEACTLVLLSIGNY